MDIQGKIILDLPLQEGVSKAGNPWKKKEWVLETFGQYPKKVKFHVFGEERINRMSLAVGSDYTISVDVESREFNGKWYTDVSAFAAQPLVQNAQQSTPGDWNQAANPGSQFGGTQQGFGETPQTQFGPQFGAPDANAGFAPAPGSNSDDLPF